MSRRMDGNESSRDEQGPSRIELEILIDEILTEKETDVYRMESKEFVRRIMDEYEYDRDSVKAAVVREIERFVGPNNIHITRGGTGYVELVDTNRVSTESKLFPDD